MPIHPTFNYIPCSMPRNHHASPNHQWPITMLHDMMDMLRSNVFSMISNPTLWPTIGVKPIYICCVTENHAFPIIDGPILIPWANRKRARTYLRLIIGFHCYICAPNPTSLKARLTLMLDNNLHVSYHICFAIGDAVPNWPSVMRVTQRLFCWFARSFGHPPHCLSILAPYIIP